MHQNRWRLGLRPRPRWPLWELTALPQLLDGLGGEEKGKEGRGGEREEKGGAKCVPLHEILNTPLLTEPPPQSLPPLNVGLRPRAQITSSLATYVL